MECIPASKFSFRRYFAGNSILCLSEQPGFSYLEDSKTLEHRLKVSLDHV